MNKKIRAAALAAVMAVSTVCSVTGCHKGELRTGNESAYILINNEDAVYPDVTPYEGGQAWKETIKNIGGTADDEKPFCFNSMIYFNDGKFKVYGRISPDVYSVSGEFDIDEADEVKFLNTRYDAFSGDKHSYYDMNTGNSEGLSDEKTESLKSDMKKLNHSKCLFMTSTGFSFANDKAQTLSPPLRYNGSKEYESWSSYVISRGMKLYSRGQFLVCKQNGYLFKNKPGDDDFTINYSDSKQGSDSSCVFNMRPDGTWDCDGSSFSGTWEQKYENLVSIKLDPEYGGRGALPDVYLFLDFDEEKVYIPIYIKCDDVLDIARGAG